MKKIIAMTLGVVFTTSVSAERLNGPRIGVTYLDEKTMAYLEEQEVEISSSSLIQFGWQFETKFFSTKNGPEGITEFVPLIGGFEQGLLVPSATWLVGLRLRNGLEVAVGPNFSVNSTGVAFTIGHTSRFGELNIPINLAYVTTKNGARISLLFGFNAAEGD